MRRLLLVVVVMLCGWASSTAAQTTDRLIATANAAAAADRHAEAIAAYEAAIAQQPSLRADLAAKLGRQYLWADQTRRAVVLLRDYVTVHPDDCDVRFDYALALLWNNDLRAARGEYQNLQQTCPSRRQQARLREAQIERWDDRQSAAAALYNQVMAEGSDAEREAARVGLGFVELEKDYDRSASAIFANEPATPSATIYEGSALAAVRLGDPASGATIIKRAEAANAVSKDLIDLREELRIRDHAAISPQATVFRDADGTTYRAAEAAGSLGWMRNGRAAALFGTSTLAQGAETLDDRWAGASVEQRFTPSLAVIAAGRAHSYESIGFHPITGELDLVITPNDRTRFDAAAARILISDNVAALQHHLAGNFVSLGVDRRLTYLTTISLSADDTDWNAGNQRQRVRFNVIHRFEGVPRITVEWPSLYMRYDRGFAFSLFSPTRYVETGPAVNVYRRFAKRWSAAAYLRVGAQREEGAAWKQLAIARLSLDRELHDVWAAGVDVSWSNSNLASATGFRRTAASLHLTRRF